jgi:hypothetical protein
MTLNDLVKIFEEGSFNPEHPFADHDLEKGIRAVIEALRDEVFPDYYVNPTWNLGDAMSVFSKILAVKP